MEGFPALLGHVEADLDVHALNNKAMRLADKARLDAQAAALPGFHFEQVARRGLVQVHGELLEKALAYDFCHMVRTRLTIELALASDREQALEHAA